MFAIAISVFVLGVVALADTESSFNLALGPQLLVDMFAWYIVGAYLGVLPSFV